MVTQIKSEDCLNSCSGLCSPLLHRHEYLALLRGTVVSNARAEVPALHQLHGRPAENAVDILQGFGFDDVPVHAKRRMHDHRLNTRRWNWASSPSQSKMGRRNQEQPGSPHLIRWRRELHVVDGTRIGNPERFLQHDAARHRDRDLSGQCVALNQSGWL